MTIFHLYYGTIIILIIQQRITFSFQYIFPMIASGRCLFGYVEKTGHLPRHGSNMGSSNITKEECALKCNSEKSCLSFEYSNTYMKCKLNEIAEPSQVPYLDFIFCTKTGRFNFVVNICLDINLVVCLLKFHLRYFLKSYSSTLP